MVPTTQSYECTVVLQKHWVEVTRTLYWKFGQLRHKTGICIWAVEAQNGYLPKFNSIEIIRDSPRSSLLSRRDDIIIMKGYLIWNCRQMTNCRSVSICWISSVQCIRWERVQKQSQEMKGSKHSQEEGNAILYIAVHISTILLVQTNS